MGFALGEAGGSWWQFFMLCAIKKGSTIVNLGSHIGNKLPIIVNLDSYYCFVKLKIF